MPLRVRRRRGATGDEWHLDEVVISIAGKTHWLWRAVDQHGVVLDILVQSRRDARAARRLPRKLMKRQERVPRVMVTDKLRSYGATARTIMPWVGHRQHKGLNNRAKNSHLPTRRRERIVKRFKSPGQAQRFLATHDQVANLFRTPTPPTPTPADKRDDRLIWSWRTSQRSLWPDPPTKPGPLQAGGAELTMPVHALPLPGSPRYAGEAVETIYAHAVAEARRYRENGMNEMIVENHGDIPFAKPGELGQETAAIMTVMTDRARQAVVGPIGINVLANAPITALACAKASGADFIRVNQWANAYIANEGFMEGRAGAAMRYRSWIGARDVRVFADVHVKHGAHAIVADRPLEAIARDAAFFEADAIIVTGQRTGTAVVASELQLFSEATDLPVMVGSGVTRDNVSSILAHADAVIVASSLKADGNWWGEVDPERVRDFVAAVQSAPD